MKVTGTEIKDKIKLITTKLQAISGDTFSSSLFYFTDEEKKDPYSIAKSIIDLEVELAQWQTRQKIFNCTTIINFKGQEHTLQYAIAVIGGYSRMAKLWKAAAGVKKKDRYDRINSITERSTKDASLIVAKPTVTKEQALAEYELVEELSNELRKAIGIANNKEMEILF